jgi:HD superfamily phosphodiesterase
MGTILNMASDYITKKLESDLPQGTTYHNLTHTIETVKYAKIIGENSGINADQFEMLILSAWFHDIGYIEKYNDHEEISAELCREFLTIHNYPQIKLEVIMRHHIRQNCREPANLLENNLDADISYIGEKFYIRSQVLRSNGKIC